MDCQGVIPADRSTQSKIAQPEVEIVIPFTTPFLTTLLFDVRNSWEQASTPTSAWLAAGLWRAGHQVLIRTVEGWNA